MTFCVLHRLVFDGDDCPSCAEDSQPGAVNYPPVTTEEDDMFAHHKPSLEKQVGGSHYRDMKIQPVEYIHANGIGFVEGSVIKYVSRWRSKNGVEDLKKARHFLDLLIELESAK